MPATRSQSKQLKIDDQQHLKAAVPTKRKTPGPAAAAAKVSKKTKKASVAGEVKDDAEAAGTEAETDNIVTINRAPVLELWAACVTAFLHKDLSWKICLSAGGAVSTICAISKGRAIGSIAKPTQDEADRRRDARQKKVSIEELTEIEVMGFTLALKNGEVLINNKPRKINESALQHKFNGLYNKTKETIESALSTWKGSEEDLNAHAFHMYEDFRPSVPTGQKGWGRKGQLNLNTIESVVKKPDKPEDQG